LRLSVVCRWKGGKPVIGECGLIAMDGENYMKHNREKIKQLCETAGTYSIAAKLIAEETERHLSVDAIKSWTCNPDSSRARTCPDWAIQALERKLKNLPRSAKTYRAC